MEIKIEVCIEVKRGRVKLSALKAGKGFVVLITGGEKPHIGAIAVAIPRPSLSNPQHYSATSSVFTLTGHKDDEIARRASEKIAKESKEVTVVIAGLHIQEAKPSEINQLVRNSNIVVKRFLKFLEENDKLDSAI